MKEQRINPKENPDKTGFVEDMFLESIFWCVCDNCSTEKKAIGTVALKVGSMVKHFSLCKECLEGKFLSSTTIRLLVEKYAPGFLEELAKEVKNNE